MKHTFTSKDLLRFLYHEMPAAEAEAIQEQLTTDADLKKEYQLLRESIAILQKTELSPSSVLVNDLMEKLHTNVQTAL